MGHGVSVGHSIPFTSYLSEFDRTAHISYIKIEDDKFVAQEVLDCEMLIKVFLTKLLYITILVINNNHSFA